MSHASVAFAVLAACSAPAKPPQPVTASAPVESALVVREVYISKPELVPEAQKQPEEMVQPQQAVVELTVNAAFDCPASAFAVDELEGSILGSNGIDRAVTYFIPKLAPEACKPSAARDYVLGMVWRRRTDTPWTIVVTPYIGQADRLDDTGLYAHALDGHTATRGPNPAAIPIKTGIWSLTNTPAIGGVDVRRDGADLVMTLDLENGNACEAKHSQWRIHALTSHAGDAAFVWATLARVRDDVHCGETFASAPLKLEQRIPAPRHARTISVAIPNINADDGLPIFRKTL
jgi:hypothetical protein